MSEKLRFDGRVAIITGAGSGLGRTHGLLLAMRGAKVVVNELPHVIERAEAVCAEIAATGGEAIAYGGAVGRDEDAQGLVAAAIERFGRVDIVINNAGIPGGGHPDDVLVEHSPTRRTEDFLDVHVRGPLQLNRAAWPYFVAQGYGRILFTGSACGNGWMRGETGFETDYAGAKSALFAIVRQTAGAGAEYGIKANMLMPWAYTRMVADALGGSELGSWMEQNLRPEQVSAGILPLLHERCPATGEAITAQGGRVARIFFAATRGYFNPDLTPEDVMANWSAVAGSVCNDGRLIDSFEQSQPREERLIAEMLASGHLPDLAWVARQPVHEGMFTSVKQPAQV